MRDGLRTRYTEHDSGTQIVGEQYRANQRAHSKLKREREKELEQLRSWRDTFGSNVPILIYAPITLSATVPVGSPVQAPKELAHALIRTRSATPVGDFSVQPALVISEEELFGQDEPQVEPNMITLRLIETVNEQLSTGTVLRLPTSTGRELVRYRIAEPYSGNSSSAIIITKAELL